MAIVQIIFDIEEDLRNRFKSKVALEGATIREILTGFIEGYVKEHKTRRQASQESAPKTGTRRKGAK